MSEGNRLREEDQEFSAALEALDKALSVKALARLRTHRYPGIAPHERDPSKGARHRFATLMAG